MKAGDSVSTTTGVVSGAGYLLQEDVQNRADADAIMAASKKQNLMALIWEK